MEQGQSMKRVWSRYDDVKSHVTSLHIEFVESVSQMQTLKIAGYEKSSRVDEKRLKAFQSLLHLRHFGVLSGGIPDSKDPKLAEIDAYLKNWNTVKIDDLVNVVQWLEEWFTKSYFYDVRIDQDNRQVIDIEATMRSAGL